MEGTTISERWLKKFATGGFLLWTEYMVDYRARENLREAMKVAGIGKGWRKREYRWLERKLKRRAATGDLQWKEAWERYVSLQVASKLGK